MVIENSEPRQFVPVHPASEAPYFEYLFADAHPTPPESTHLLSLGDSPDDLSFEGAETKTGKSE